MESALTPVGRRVLVVDDDSDLLRMVELWLVEAGYTVVTCDQFAAAKRQLATAPPDVLLTDVRLGAFNGLQLVILGKEQRPQMQAVVMSAYDDVTLRKEAAERGARYLLKPFSSGEVLGCLIDSPPAMDT